MKSRSSDKVSAKTDGRRVSRVEKEIHSVVSTYIIQNLQHELPGLVTIGRVQVPADLRNARIYVSFLNINHSESVEESKLELAKLDKALRILQSWSKDIQAEIDQKLKMKYVPKVQFFADESTAKILKIEKLLSSMKINHDAAETDDDSEEDDF
jgi:ribosome-binding factor A